MEFDIPCMPDDENKKAWNPGLIYRFDGTEGSGAPVPSGARKAIGVNPKDEHPLLIVEDDPEDLNLLLVALKGTRYEKNVVVAQDGAEALDFLFGAGKFAGRPKTMTPSLVVLDIKLPKLSGIEVLRKIREDALLKYLFVVVLTTSPRESERLEAQRLGTTLYLTKPMKFSGYKEITKKIEQLLS